METWEFYQEQLDHYREELENDNYDVEQDVVDLEENLKREIEMSFEENDAPYRKVLKAVKALKREFDFYDQEGELDMMFPDRHDDDFDEDSMSYDSVFGDD